MAVALFCVSSIHAANLRGLHLDEVDLPSEPKPSLFSQVGSATGSFFHLFTYLNPFHYVHKKAPSAPPKQDVGPVWSDWKPLS